MKECPGYLLLRASFARCASKALAICLLSALSFGRLHALDPNKRLTQYLHKTWRVQDSSIPAGDLYSITQTSDGFLWFAGHRNLFKFDGVRFVSWALPSTVTARRIRTVYGDRSGGLWVIGDEEVFHIRGGVVRSHFELPGVQSTQNLSEDPDGSLWIVRSGPKSYDAPLCHVNDQTFQCFGKNDGLSTGPLDALCSDGQGGFWLGGANTLIHWHNGVSESYSVNGQIISILPGEEGSLWLGMLETGLAQFRKGIIRPFVTQEFDGRKFPVTRLISDREGNVWVATDANGVFRIHADEVEHFAHKDGLSADTVWTLFEDSQGIVWVATTNGIDSFRDPAITTFSTAEGLSKDAAVGILAAKDGSILVANDGSLDRITGGKVSSVRREQGLPGVQVTSLLEDHAGTLWVGVDDSLYWFKDGRFHALSAPDRKPLGMVSGLAEDTAGDIWAECKGNPRKLIRIRDFQVRETFLESQVPPGHSLAAAKEGAIWIGAASGELLLFRNNAVEQRFPVNLHGSSLADMILPQADGSVLVGSPDGLFGLRDGKTHRMTEKNGLPCKWVYSFVKDSSQNWWLATECGIVKLPDSELQRWWSNPDAVLKTRFYDAADGARPDTPSFQSAAYSSDGRVWFVTGAVVQVVDPARISNGAPEVQTYIESVIVDRQELSPSPNLRLPQRPHNVQIDYTLPFFASPQKVNFRYKLDNYDQDWHEPGTRRQAFYTDLPPGRFLFRVAACNEEGVCSSTPATLGFTVTPAYYQTVWFRLFFFAALVALLLAAYYWRLRQLRHQFAMTLDARVSERTRIARELHDTLLQSFQGVLLHLQAVSMLLPKQPVEAQMKLHGTIDLAAKAVTEGRQAVQGLRESTLHGNELALAIRTLGEELVPTVPQPPPTLQVFVEGESKDLHPIVRDEVYRIAAEALRNAFQHAHASRIEVEIHYGNEEFRLRVRDDGVGMPSETLSQKSTTGHYGIPGMRERATVIKAKLALLSGVGEGTELELRIPANLSYASPQRRAWFSN